MLRLADRSGWWLITHQDHARLASEFASHWGNAVFAAPRPAKQVLEAIRVHDDGWAARDAQPKITSQGKPAAFSQDLVGKYAAFEEIDLAEYLAVRERALDQVASRCAYAALLVSMHTFNLLTERADRSTIAPSQLPLLDTFLSGQATRQDSLRALVLADSHFTDAEVRADAIENNFRLLQAVDNLSLLSCVDYPHAARLLHPLLRTDGKLETVAVTRFAFRSFRLDPYPFDQPNLEFEVPARYIPVANFSSSEDLQSNYAAAPVQRLTIKITR